MCIHIVSYSELRLQYYTSSMHHNVLYCLSAYIPCFKSERFAGADDLKAISHLRVVKTLHPHAVQWNPFDHLVRGVGRWNGRRVDEDIVKL